MSVFCLFPFNKHFDEKNLLNLLTKGRSITIFEIIQRGHQDIIIFHIQNEKSDVNREQFSMFFLCFSYHSQKVKNPDFWKKKKRTS